MAITREEETEFLFWLERNGSPEQAATMARVSYGAMRQRKSRNKMFRTAWEQAAGDFHRARVEDFMVRLRKSGDARSAYLSAELTSGWYYSRMLRDPAFRARVEFLSAVKPDELWADTVERALAGEDVNAKLKVLDRMMGNLQPAPPRGG